MSSQTPSDPGRWTREEIFQQPDIWPDTLRRIRELSLSSLPPAVLTGAGTSAYVGEAVQPAWPGSLAVASTDLFLDFDQALVDRPLVVSFARSGSSPESVAVVEKIRRARPGVRHLSVTADKGGALARRPDVKAIVLDERTNDRSLVMTSSFSNLVLAGLGLARLKEVETALPSLCTGAASVLQHHDATAQEIARKAPTRVAVLASSPLLGAAREAWLKILEMTAGRVVPLVETYLGLRHGPMSFIHADTLVLCLLSSDPKRRRYEGDLVAELKTKDLGRRVALGDPGSGRDAFDRVISTEASQLPDYLRTPAEIVFPQLLGYHLSLHLGFDPDNPSPKGVINRVVQGVRIYEG